MSIFPAHDYLLDNYTDKKRSYDLRLKDFLNKVDIALRERGMTSDVVVVSNRVQTDYKYITQDDCYANLPRRTALRICM